MLESTNPSERDHRKIALIGNHLPRRCGIATFTSDLLSALKTSNRDTDFSAVVMNDIPEGYRYPPQVHFEIDSKTIEDYRLAADFLNMNQTDVVCLQHEFGIFGGESGSYVLELLDNLRMPVVTTLHTVLRQPPKEHISMLKRIAALSDRMVVISRKAGEILETVYGIPKTKIAVIPHGIPDIPFVDPNYYKDLFGVEGKKVILTFGLLSPNKGIETMIEALPKIVERHPDTVYIVLGETHPHVKKNDGESYRTSLRQLARKLGVDGNLIFYNRFVEKEKLCEFLGAADLYVTPYLHKEQISSGTLAYALGAGKAVVSTPYWYAEEMLADGRGRLVPFRDSAAFAREINDLLDHETERHAMRKKAYNFCREMTWNKVAGQYMDLFREICKNRRKRPAPLLGVETVKAAQPELPELKLDHLFRLTDDVGILQHAKYIIPNREHGYCTDDNARALIAALMAGETAETPERLSDCACTYLSFLQHAFNPETGRFRNFMSYDRRWLEKSGSEDSHGRAVWGLGESIVLTQSEAFAGAALQVFESAVPALLEFTAPRAWAFGLIGIHAYLEKFGGDSRLRRIRQILAERLFELYQRNAGPDWPWIEPVLTYANGRIPQALILAGAGLEREDIVKTGVRILEWLLKIQTSRRGCLAPVGNDGWYPHGKNPARFDQQPIEVLALIEACRDAWIVTGESRWLESVRTCLDWFLGCNDLNLPLYDFASGGCRDGLGANGPNRNEGAESTLAWLMSLLNFYRLKNLQVSEAAAPDAAASGSGKE